MSRTVYNPYLPSWEHVPDGEPHVFGNRLYVFGSHDATDGKEFCVGDYVCWSAPLSDLTSWCFEGTIFRKQDDPDNAEHMDALYAPDVCPGPDGRYYLYYAPASTMRGDPGYLGVAVCDEPGGHYRYVGKVMLPDGQVLTSDVGYGMIFDPALYVEDGQVWLYWGFGMPRKSSHMPESAIEGSWVAPLSADMYTLAGEPKRLAPSKLHATGTSFEGHPFFEASSFRRIKGHYYFIYSSLQGHELCWAHAESPMGPVTYGGVIHSNGNVGLPGYETQVEAAYYMGNNHGSLVELPDGRVFVFGHRHTNGNLFARQGVAEPVTIRDDGFVEQAEMTSCGLNGGPLPAWNEIPAYTCCHLRAAEGAVMYGGNVVWNEAHPRVREESDACCTTSSLAYVSNLRDGSEVGWKYLEFSGDEKSLLLEVRGSLEGSVTLHLDTPTGLYAASVPVSACERWTMAKAPLDIAVEGVHAVYLRTHGDGVLDLSSLAFCDSMVS